VVHSMRPSPLGVESLEGPRHVLTSSRNIGSPSKYNCDVGSFIPCEFFAGNCSWVIVPGVNLPGSLSRGRISDTVCLDRVHGIVQNIADSAAGIRNSVMPDGVVLWPPPRDVISGTDGHVTLQLLVTSGCSGYEDVVADGTVRHRFCAGNQLKRTGSSGGGRAGVVECGGERTAGCTRGCGGCRLVHRVVECSLGVNCFHGDNLRLPFASRTPFPANHTAIKLTK